MKIHKFDDQESWLAARRGRITGSRLKDIVVKRGTEKKIGFYELIAERLGIPSDDESAMSRGHRLEAEAIEQFTKETGKKVNTDLVIWSREDNEGIAISPDGVVGKTAAIEVKCLSSARHIEAVLTKKIPKEYEYQVLQYFIVNESLKTLYFVFYDPRLVIKPFFMIEVKRDSLKEDIDEMLAYQSETLLEVEKIVNELSDF